MAWKPTQIGDLSGRTAIVTGSNSGIGFVEAKELAEHGAHVIMAVRNVDAGRAAAARINGSTTVEHLDLASQDSVRAFAAGVTGPIDLLINNAGVMSPPKYRETPEGHELQFGTNHLGHFALTGLLMPHLLAAKAPRVTTVASIAHQRGNESVVEGNPEAGYNPMVSYGNSKLANLMFALELDRRVNDAAVSLVSNAAHPGVSNTNLMSSPDGMGANKVVKVVGPAIVGLLLPGPEGGAESILYAATEGGPGTYWGPQGLREMRGAVGPAKRSKIADDAELARELWERSEEWTGVTFAF